MPQKFADRVKMAMEKEGIATYAELSQRAEVAPNSITRWLEKGEIPRGSSRLALANALNVDTEWLRTGVGEMELTTRELTGHRSWRNTQIQPDEETSSLDEDLLTITDPPYLGVSMVMVKRFLRKRGLGLSDETESRLVVRVVRSCMAAKQNPTEADAELELVQMAQGR
jgi:transcriptional regulator with XRE-family HTH domain